MKKFLTLILCVCVLLATVACSAISPSADYYTSQNAAVAPAAPAGIAPAPAAVPMPTGAPSLDEAEAGWGGAQTDKAADIASGTSGTVPTDANYGGHKIIRTADISMETREFDTHIAYIRQRIETLGGYVGSSNINGKEPVNYGDAGRNAYISARIPQGQLETFLADARGLATVTNENTYSDDITSSYFDTETRLKVYQTQRERILELLAKATTMESVIALEQELARLTYEIEQLTSSLRRWDDLVAFATVNLSVYELTAPTPVSGPDSMGTRINEGFRQTLSGVSVFFEDLVVFLVSASPVLIILALIGVLVFFLVRRSRKKHKERMAQHAASPAGASSFVSAYGAPSVPAPEAGKAKKDKAKTDEETKQ